MEHISLAPAQSAGHANLPLQSTLHERQWGRYVEAIIRFNGDASPWRLGAVLEVQGRFAAYLYDEVSQFDAQTLGVAREISLDVAFSRYVFDVLEHLLGKLNIWADALSGTCLRFLDSSRACSAQKKKKIDPHGQSWWQAECWTMDGVG